MIPHSSYTHEEWSNEVSEAHTSVCVRACVYKKDPSHSISTFKSTRTEWGHVFACMHVCQEIVIRVESDMGLPLYGRKSSCWLTGG